MISSNSSLGPLQLTVLGQYLGRNDLKLARDESSRGWIVKSTKEKANLLREAMCLELSKSDGVGVPESELRSVKYGNKTQTSLLLKWEGDRPFTVAPLKAWGKLGVDLALLQISLSRKVEHFQVRNQPYSVDGVYGLPAEIIAETAEIHAGLKLKRCVCHGDFQLGNIIQVHPGDRAEHRILDFEDAAIDFALADAARLVWSGWANGINRRKVMCFLRGYGSAFDGELDLVALSQLIVASHCLWLEHLVNNGAADQMIGRAMGSLITLRKQTPAWFE